MSLPQLRRKTEQQIILVIFKFRYLEKNSTSPARADTDEGQIKFSENIPRRTIIIMLFLIVLQTSPTIVLYY